MSSALGRRFMVTLRADHATRPGLAKSRGQVRNEAALHAHESVGMAPGGLRVGGDRAFVEGLEVGGEGGEGDVGEPVGLGAAAGQVSWEGDHQGFPGRVFLVELDDVAVGPMDRQTDQIVGPAVAF